VIAAPHVVTAEDASTYPLGVITMHLLAGAADTDATFAVAEFSGVAGPWTVPHVHQRGEEFFYVLDGAFTFDVGFDEIRVRAGAFLVIPRGTRHQMRAHEDGSRLLTFWTPGGPEEMFKELSRLPAGSIRDPEVRRALGARFDSVPV
jgi:quercetin dioxygenase-like cupin family protein